jgi:hypothetical protein
MFFTRRRRLGEKRFAGAVRARPWLEGLEGRALMTHYSSGTLNAALDYDSTLSSQFGTVPIYEHIKEDVTFTTSGKDSVHITYKSQSAKIGGILSSKGQTITGIWTDTFTADQKSPFSYGFILSVDGHGKVSGQIPKISFTATETQKFVLNGKTLYSKSKQVSLWVAPDVFIGTTNGKLPPHITATYNFTDGSGFKHHANWSIYP